MPRFITAFHGAAVAAAVLLAACSGPVPTAPDAPSLTLVPGTTADVTESLSITGDPVAGATVLLNFTLTNMGTADLPVSVGSPRAAAAFGEFVIPTGIKRQQPTVNTQTDDPLILCEAYRGTHGGLTQAQYSDICRIWWYSAIPAGGSKTASLPIKLVAGEGDYTAWGGAIVYSPFGQAIGLNDNMWMPLPIHVAAAPPKIGGGGGGTTSSLPDLQATARASSGSPSAGNAYTYTFTVKNSGKIQADNATFTATVAGGIGVVSAFDGAASCTVSGDTISCSLGTIPTGTSRDVTVSVIAPVAAGTYIATGTFAGSNGDSNLANNTAAVTVTVK